MGRLLFALFFIEITLSKVELYSFPQAHPVPKPKITGKGSEIVGVILNTNIKYDDAISFEDALRFLNDIKILEYSKPLGVIAFTPNIGPNSDTLLPYVPLQYAIPLENADCRKVKLWMNQVVPSSSIYESANVVCSDTPTPSEQIHPIFQAADWYPSQPLEIKPVPKPEGHLIGKGKDLVYVKIYTSVLFAGGDAYKYYDYFDKTKIAEHSQLLAEGIDRLTYEVEDRRLLYSFFIKKTICEKVAYWLEQVVNSSNFFKSFATTGRSGLQCSYSMPALHLHKQHKGQSDDN
ncbi:hypothetical protein COOONC_17037 [Cooperia oncophora]